MLDNFWTIFYETRPLWHRESTLLLLKNQLWSYTGHCLGTYCSSLLVAKWGLAYTRQIIHHFQTNITSLTGYNHVFIPFKITMGTVVRFCTKFFTMFFDKKNPSRSDDTFEKKTGSYHFLIFLQSHFKSHIWQYYFSSNFDFIISCYDSKIHLCKLVQGNK